MSNTEDSQSNLQARSNENNEPGSVQSPTEQQSAVDQKSHATEDQVMEGAKDEVVDLTEEGLKDLRTKFKSQMSLSQEPLDEFRHIIEILKAVAQSQGHVFRDKPDLEVFFFKEWLEPVMFSLATQIKTNLTNEQFRESLIEVPPLLAQILSNNLTNIYVHKALASIFDVKSKIYQNHFVSKENAILSQTKNSEQSLSEEDKAWRDALKEGDPIEAIKIDPGLKCKCWQAAVVKSITGKKLRIGFPGDSKMCDRDVEIYGPEIAKPGERSQRDSEFRKNLTVGERIDCFDGTGFWYASMIMDKKVRPFQGEQLDHVEVAFRVPHPNGDKTDKNGNKYFGWEEVYDEWMPECSARIAPYQTHTTDSLDHQTHSAQIAIPAAATATTAKQSQAVDDSLDAMVEEVEGRRVYAVQRKQCGSDLMIDFLNAFGGLGGFDNLLQRLQDFGEDANGADELNYIGSVVTNLAKCQAVLHQSVVKQFFEKIEEAVITKLMKATNRQQRNTAKEITDDIIDRLYGDILPRLSSRDAVGLQCDKNVHLLKLGILFLEQDFLSRRVDGIKLINDISNKCLRSLEQPPKSTDAVVSALQESNFEKKMKMLDEVVGLIVREGHVLNLIFSKDHTHIQLLQRTENLLRILMVKDKLDDTSRQLIWQSSQINDGEMKIELYKVLTGAAPDMQRADRQFFFDKILSIPSQSIVSREVELIIQLSTATRGRTDCEDITQQGLEFIWKLSLGSGQDIALQVVNRAQMGLSDILKFRSMAVKIEYAEKLASKASDLDQGFLVVKILSKFLKQGFEGNFNLENSEIQNLSDLIQQLEKKHNLYSSVFQNLVDYMSVVDQQIKDGKVQLDNDTHTKTLHGFYAHCDQLTQRLEFIKFYAGCSNKVSISSEQLNVLWEELALKSRIGADKQLIYQWLREVCNIFLSEREKLGNNIMSGHGASIVTLEDLMSFYKEKMLRDDDADIYRDLSLEGFHCIQSFFVLLNGIAGKLIRITESYGMYRGKHYKTQGQAGASQGATQAKSTETEKAQPSVPTPAATAIEYNGKTGQMTSYSSANGPGYTAYSWNNNGNENKTQTTATGTGTTPTGVMHGPWKNPDTNADAKGEMEITSSLLKVEIDPEDLTIEVLVPPNELEGYKILWRLATESKDAKATEAAAKLLIQMHNNVHASMEHRVPEFDDLFIKECLEIAEKQKVRILSRTEEDLKQIEDFFNEQKQNAANTSVILAKKPVQERRIIRALVLIKELIRESEKNGTHDLRPHESLSSKNTQLTAMRIHNNIKQGEQYRQNIELSIGNQATLWDLKKRIGIEIASFSIDGGKTYGLHPGPDGLPTPPVHPAAIKLFQMTETKDVKDHLNGVTLKVLNFKNNELLGAFRKGAYLTRKGPIVVDNEQTGEAELTKNAEKAVIEIFERFSEVSEKTHGAKLMTLEQVIKFVQTVTKTPSNIHDPRVSDLLTKYCMDVNAPEKFIDINGLRRFCLSSCLIGKEESLRNNFRLLGYGQDLKKLPQDHEPQNILQLRQSKEDMPRYKIANNEKYFDLLIELLQIDPEVEIKARDLIATLATQPFLFSVVSKLEFTSEATGQMVDEDEAPSPSKFDWSSIFDSENINKMLYSLEIISAILVGYSDTEKSEEEIVGNLVTWVQRFVELRGLQEIQRQLASAIEKVMTIDANQKRYQKKLVVQLFQLINMFIVTASDSLSALKQNDQEMKDESQADQTSQENQEASQANADQIDSNTPKNDQIDSGDAKATTNEKEKKDDDKPKQIREDSLRFLSQVFKTDSLGQQILKIIDGADILNQVTKLLELLLDSDIDTLRDDRALFESALSLWTHLAKGQTEKGNPPQIDQRFLIRGLIEVNNLAVRISFFNNFSNIAKESSPLAEKLFAVTFNQLKNLEDLKEFKNNKGRRTTEYFSLVCSLIPLVASNNIDLLLEILSVAIRCSFDHNSTEIKGEFYIDSTRVGLFKIATVVLGLLKKDKVNLKKALEIINEAKFIDHIHKDCLFYYANQTGEDVKMKDEVVKRRNYRCVTSDSRSEAYSFMNEYQSCLEPKEMAEYIKDYMLPLVRDVQRPKMWKHQPSGDTRIHGHCGLVNLGCICYMISMLQQFFLVPQFRYQLLKAEDNQPEKLEEWRDEVIDDNLLKQLRRLFGYLEMSARQAYNPKPFCFAFKEFDGSPTKISEQKDSQEFLNIFFDRLEDQLKPTSQRHLLRDVFAGNQCTQLICSSCGKIKNRIELFYNLSLQVKGSSGIYDSLGQLAKGQTIEDFNCDFCNKRTNVVRRQLLADTPNTLIVHLQRIIFSFDTLQNDKVNDRFEFPTILDLKEYSFKERMKMEGLQLENMNTEDNTNLDQLMNITDDEYIYRLVGVNVHVGTADRGHYYSLIDINRGLAEPDPYAVDDKGNSKYQDWAHVSKDPWKKFDDSELTYFNFEKNLQPEAFGQTQGARDGAEAQSDAMTDEQYAKFLSGGGKSYGKSAYMLVYERKSKKPIHEVSVTESGQEEQKELDFRAIEKFVPEWIEKEVTEDNQNFHVDAQMFHAHFFDHVKNILKVVGNDLVMQTHLFPYEYAENITMMKSFALNFAGKVLFDMQCYYEKNTQISDIATALDSLLIFCDSPFHMESGHKSLVVEFVNEYMLKDNCQHFFKIMFTCTSISARRYASQIASKSISRLIRLYNDCKPEVRESVEGIKALKETYSKVIDLSMMALMDKECQRNAVKLEHFFKFLQDVGTSSVSAAQHLLERSDAISDLIDFILGNASPRVTDKVEKRVAMGGIAPPPFQPLYTLISFLVRMTHTAYMDFGERLPSHVDLKLHGNYEQYKSYGLQEEALVMITGTDWLEKVIFDQKYQDDQNKDFCKAMAHMCYKDLSFSKLIISKLLKAIGFASDEGLTALLNVVGEIALVKDEFQLTRLEYLFGYGFLMHSKDANGNFIYGKELQDEKPNFDEVYLIVSNLDSRKSTDGLIQLIWSYHRRFENKALTFLSKLLTLANSDKEIAEYLSKLPSYDYNMVRFTDFIRPWLFEKMAENQNYKTATGFKEKEEQLSKVASLLDLYEIYLTQQLKQAGLDGPSDFIQAPPPQPYIVLRTAGKRAEGAGTQQQEEEEKVVREEMVDEALTMKVVQVAACWLPSRPLGRGIGNLSLQTMGEAVNITKEINFDSGRDEEQPQDSKGLGDQDVLMQGQDEEDLKGKVAPEDQEMIVDMAFDANPVQGKVVQTSIKQSYPDGKLCKDLLFRIAITNLTDKCLKIDVQFKEKSKEKKINLSYPVGGVVDFLKPGLTGSLMTLAKVDPEGDPVNIDDLEIKVIQSVHDDNAFQMNLFSSQTDVPNTMQQNQQSAGVATGSNVPSAIKDQRRNAVSYDTTGFENTANAGVGDGIVYGPSQPQNTPKIQDSYIQASPDDMPAAFDGQKPCPICTFLNAAQNAFCEMCQSEF